MVFTNTNSTQWLLSNVGEWLNSALTLPILDLREAIISTFSDHDNKRIVNVTNCIVYNFSNTKLLLKWVRHFWVTSLIWNNYWILYKLVDLTVPLLLKLHLLRFYRDLTIGFPCYSITESNYYGPVIIAVTFYYFYKYIKFFLIFYKTI